MIHLRWIALMYWTALTVGLLHPKGGALPGLVLGSLGEWPGAAHLLAFVVLAALVCASRLRVPPLSSVATLFVYGLATELAQISIPGRHASLLDALANTLGIAVGIILWRWQRPIGAGRRRKKRRQSSRPAGRCRGPG